MIRVCCFAIAALACVFVAANSARADDSTAANPTPTTFTFSPTVGMSFQSMSHSDHDQSDNMQWLGTIQSRLDVPGDQFQFSGSLYLQYGQSISSTTHPLKTQDDIVLSLTPSMTISPDLGLRLFFETTGETTMSPGTVDSEPTNFLDPLFLYQTLFLGQKIIHNGGDQGAQLSLVYGVGYAFQQTVTNNFVLTQNRKFVVDQNNPLANVQDQVTLEQGYSAVLQLDYAAPVAENVSFTTNFKAVAFTKDPKPAHLQDSRVGALLLSGLQYKILSLNYTLHLVYDRDISPRRQLDQTLVFGLRFNL